MKYIYKLGAIALIASTIVACSDEFLEEKKVYGSFGEESMYSSYEGATDRVNTLYRMMMPQACQGDGNGTAGLNDYTSTGSADKWAKSTLEYGGFSEWVKPDTELDYTNVTDYFYVINDIYSPWGNIRNANDIISHMEGNTSMTEEERNKILGQAYFFRAFRYWTLVKTYGGVPIILEPQDPIVGGGDGSDKVVPRSKTGDCIAQICADLDRAAAMLPVSWGSSDFGRITAGAAAALKGRVLLFYASPLFNRDDNADRWTAAYEANKAALSLLNVGGFNLAYEGNPGVNGSNWAKIFLNNEGSDGSNSEAVLVTLFNNVDKTDIANYDKWNGWEHSIRPINANGNGGLHPTAEMVDLFPMASGAKPTATYDQTNPFWYNRDPRFYRTFAFPGVVWAFSSNGNDLNAVDGTKRVYSWYPENKYSSSGSDFSLWSYTWYKKDDDVEKISSLSSGYTADLIANKNSAVYIRKRSDDPLVNANPLYKFSITASTPKGFQQSAAPQMLMRYTEVLLNFAEAAAASGHTDEAVDALAKIRARAGIPEGAQNYGLGTALTDRAKCLAAVLYERQIELAYEGKAFDDNRRWMLFDGGVGQEAIKASWALSGFGGNTCTYLGVTPLNGQRRHEIVVYSETVAAEGDANDPLASARVEPLDLTETMTSLTADTKVADMINFYKNNLKRKNVNVDSNDESQTINFLPQYYFIGLKRSAMQTNPTLEQNVGWHDFGRNSDGTFDPLAN